MQLIKKGDDAYKAQKYNDAIDYYTKAVVFTPQDKVTMLKIANLYKLIGNNTKALSFYNKILTLDAKNTDAYFNKGLIFSILCLISSNVSILPSSSTPLREGIKPP